MPEEAVNHLEDLERRSNQNFINIDRLFQNLKNEILSLRNDIKIIPTAVSESGSSKGIEEVQSLQHQNFVALNKRIDDLKQGLEKIKSLQESKPVSIPVPPIPSVDDKRIVRIESNLNQISASLEQLKQVPQEREEVDDEDISSKMSELSHRTNENFINIDTSFENINKRISALVNEFDNVHRKLDGKDTFSGDMVNGIVNRLESLEGQAYQRPMVQQSLETESHHSSAELEEFRKELKEIRKSETKSKMGLFEIEKRLAAMESSATLLAPGPGIHAKSSPALERKIKSVEDKFEEKIKSLEDIMMLLEVDIIKNRGTSMVEVPTKYEDRLKTLEEKLSEVERLKLRMPAESIAQEPRIRNLEENVSLIEADMKKSMQDMEKKVLKTLASGTISEDAIGMFTSSLTDELQKMKTETEKAKILRAQLERLEKTTARKEHVDRVDQDLMDQVAVLQEQVDRIIAGGKTANAISTDAEYDLQESFEGYKRFLDKRIIDMEERLHEIVKDEARKIMLTQEARKIMDRLENLEREVEHRAYAVVVKEFESFAEAIDKKFPHLVTRDELEDKLQHFKMPVAKEQQPKQRLQAQQAIQMEKPDIRPIMDRLDQLEDRIRELGESMNEPRDDGAIVID